MAEALVISKNAREEFRIERKTFAGQQFVNVRLFFREGDEWRPGKQGLAVAPDLARQIAAVMIEVAGGNGGAKGD